MSSYDLFFGVAALACGLFCLYSAFMMKKTGIISKTLILDKETAKMKCTNVGEFILTILPCTVILGIIVFVYGVATLIDAYVKECGSIVTLLLVVSGVTLVWFGVKTSKAKKIYFE